MNGPFDSTFKAAKVPFPYGVYNNFLGISPVERVPERPSGRIAVKVSCPAEGWEGSGHVDEQGYEGTFGYSKTPSKNTPRMGGLHRLARREWGFEGEWSSDSGNEGKVAWRRSPFPDLSEMQSDLGNLDGVSNSKGFSRDLVVLGRRFVYKTSDPGKEIGAEFSDTLRLFLKGAPVVEPSGIAQYHGRLFLVEPRHKSTRDLFLDAIQDEDVYRRAHKAWVRLLSKLVANESPGDFKLDNLVLDDSDNFLVTDHHTGFDRFRNWIKSHDQDEYLHFPCRLCHFLFHRPTKDDVNPLFLKGRKQFEAVMPLDFCESVCGDKAEFLGVRKRKL